MLNLWPTFPTRLQQQLPCFLLKCPETIKTLSHCLDSLPRVLYTDSRIHRLLYLPKFPRYVGPQSPASTPDRRAELGDSDGRDRNQMDGEQSVGEGAYAAKDRGDREGEGELSDLKPGERQAELNTGDHVILI